MRPTRALKAVAALGAVALLAAACGSSTPASTNTTASGSGTTASTASGGGTTTTAATTSNGGGGGTITVGELDAITGIHANVGSWLIHGVKVGVYAVNQAGGVMGKQLTITASDTAGDSVDAVPALRKLMLKKPDFVVGPFSYVITTVIKDFGPAKTVDFTIGGTTTIDHMQYPYVFRTTPSDATMAAGMAAYAISKGYKNCAMVFDTSAAAQSLVPFVKAAYTHNGGKLSLELNVAPSQTSYRSEVVKLKTAKPDCIFMQTDDPTAVTFFNNMKQLGALDVPIVSTDTGTDAKFAQAMGWSYAEKYLSGMNGAAPTGSAYSTFVKNTQAVYHAPPVTLSQNMYDAVIIAALAMDEAHSTDPSVWVKKVMDVSNPPGTVCYTYPSCVKLIKAGTPINYEGATGPEDFNKYHNVFGAWDVVRFNSSHSLYKIGHVSASTVSQFSKAFANVS